MVRFYSGESVVDRIQGKSTDVGDTIIAAKRIFVDMEELRSMLTPRLRPTRECGPEICSRLLSRTPPDRWCGTRSETSPAAVFRRAGGETAAERPRQKALIAGCGRAEALQEELARFGRPGADRVSAAG